MMKMLKSGGAALLAVAALQPLAAAEPKQGPKPTTCRCSAPPGRGR